MEHNCFIGETKKLSCHKHKSQKIPKFQQQKSKIAKKITKKMKMKQAKHNQNIDPAMNNFQSIWMDTTKHNFSNV